MLMSCDLLSVWSSSSSSLLVPVLVILGSVSRGEKFCFFVQTLLKGWAAETTFDFEEVTLPPLVEVFFLSGKCTVLVSLKILQQSSIKVHSPQLRHCGQQQQCRHLALGPRSLNNECSSEKCVSSELASLCSSSSSHPLHQSPIFKESVYRILISTVLQWSTSLSVCVLQFD